MPKLELTPIVGMNIRQEDDALQLADRQFGRRLKVRDAVNVNIEPTGELVMRKSGRQITSLPYKNLWQSPLHKDVFAELAGALVLINMDDMSHKTLGVTDGDNAYAVVNNNVMIAGRGGIFKYNGVRLTPLTVDTPAQPIADISNEGNLLAGTYGIAVSWIADVEGSCSAIEFVEVQQGGGPFKENKKGSIHVTLPFCYNENVTKARVYVTNPNGTELLLFGEFERDTDRVDILNVDNLTSPPTFVGMEPMPTGKFIKYWNGRLLTADRNVIRFSEAMAYHINSPVYGYVELPQRITFMEPLEEGIWVGMTTGVVYLQGRDFDSMLVNRTGALSPVPRSAITVKAEVVRSATQAGENVVLWLSDNGYVIGNNQGQVIELQSDDMIGITGTKGQTIVVDERVTSLIK